MLSPERWRKGVGSADGRLERRWEKWSRDGIGIFPSAGWKRMGEPQKKK